MNSFLSLICTIVVVFISSNVPVVIQAQETADPAVTVEEETVVNESSNDADDLMQQLFSLSDAELEEICTSRGFEFVKEVVVNEETGENEELVYSHEQYVDAAKQCLEMEAEMETILKENPELVNDIEAEAQRMKDEKDRLEQELLDAQMKLQEAEREMKEDRQNSDQAAFVHTTSPSSDTEESIKEGLGGTMDQEGQSSQAGQIDQEVMEEAVEQQHEDIDEVQHEHLVESSDVVDDSLPTVDEEMIINHSDEEEVIEDHLDLPADVNDDDEEPVTVPSEETQASPEADEDVKTKVIDASDENVDYVDLDMYEQEEIKQEEGDADATNISEDQSEPEQETKDNIDPDADTADDAPESQNNAINNEITTQEEKAVATMTFEQFMKEFVDKIKEDFSLVADIILPKHLRGPLMETVSPAIRIAKNAVSTSVSLVKRYSQIVIKVANEKMAERQKDKEMKEMEEMKNKLNLP